MSSEWVKSTQGHRFLYSSVTTIAPNKGRIFVKGKDGDLITVIDTDSIEEELMHLNEQMDAIEGSNVVPLKKAN